MKNSTRNKVNLIFSSFLVIGYVVCSYFFSTLSSQVSGIWGNVIQTLILFIFGLLLFYATRVGEGKQVHRFSLAVLLLVVVPCLYVIATGYIEALPLHAQVAPAAADGSGSTQGIVMMLASVALGYAIPYTFLSGYELKEYGEPETDEEADEAEETLLEGGLAEVLAEAEAEAEIDAVEADVDAQVLTEETEE